MLEVNEKEHRANSFLENFCSINNRTYIYDFCSINNRIYTYDIQIISYSYNEITSITFEVDFLSRKIASLLFSELETLEIFYHYDVIIRL